MNEDFDEDKFIRVEETFSEMYAEICQHEDQILELKAQVNKLHELLTALNLMDRLASLEQKL